MKLLVMFGLLLGAGLAFGTQATTYEAKSSSAIKQQPKRLELSIFSDKQKYKLQGKIKLTAMLTNKEYVEDIFVYGTLGWGYLSSFTYTIRDASGKRIQPAILADDLTLPILRDDTTAFVKLPPSHCLGVSFVEKLDRLNLNRPGKYSLFVEYHCPISKGEADLKDFWSKEDGILKSNIVWVEVVP